MRQGRALRQFTLSAGKSAGRNSSGRITIFHRGGGSKRLHRIIDMKRSTSSMGIVERVEYDPNRSSRIAAVRWVEGVQQQRKCYINTVGEEFAPPPRKFLAATSTTTIRRPFSFSSLPGMVVQGKVASACFYPGLMSAAHVVVGSLSTKLSKSPFTSTSKDGGSVKTCAKDVFFSAFSKGDGDSASLSSYGFPRIAVAGAKPAFFVPRMREEVGESEIRKSRTDSITWAHRIKRKTAVSWHSFRVQETLGLAGAAVEHTNESKSKMDQVSLHAKSIAERGPKDGTYKVDRAPVSYIIASHQLEAGKMVMNCDLSKPSTRAKNAYT